VRTCAQEVSTQAIEHTYAAAAVCGKESGIHTMMSHGEIYCGTSCLTTMARQLGLKRDEIVQLVECALSRDEYEKRLRGRGKLYSRAIVGRASGHIRFLMHACLKLAL